MPFNFKHPLRVNDIDPIHWRNKLPGVILQQRLKLLFHRSTPVRNAKCSLKMARLSSGILSSMSHARGEPRYSPIGPDLRLKNTWLTACAMSRSNGLWWRRRA